MAVSAKRLRTSDSLGDWKSFVNVGVPKKLKRSSGDLKGVTLESSTPTSGGLPVAAFQGQIAELIDQCDVTIISGSAGSGKSTQVPQYILLHYVDKNFRSLDVAKLPRIAITQPRRVAALSLADKVAGDLRERQLDYKGIEVHKNSTYAPKKVRNLGAVGGLVGYCVRFQEERSQNTRILYLTDGMLIRQAMQDPDLTRYDIVIVDEAHERALKSDILMGWLKLLMERQKRGEVEGPRINDDNEIIQRNRSRSSKLKVVIMSATLERASFESFFRGFRVGLLEIPGRTFPIQIHYAPKTIEDLTLGALQTILQIICDRRRPLGDILVFLTGREQIVGLKSLLENRLQVIENTLNLQEEMQGFLRIVSVANNTPSGKMGRWTVNDLFDCKGSDADQIKRFMDIVLDYSENLYDLMNKLIGRSKILSIRELIAEVIKRCSLDEMVNIDFGISASAIEWSGEAAHSREFSQSNLRLPRELLQIRTSVHPLYAQMSLQEQSKVFEPTAENCRKVILATNVAETSLTIPSVKYVVDVGKVKLDFGRSLKVVDVSQAMAIQRAGRAGRTMPGETFRLFPSLEGLIEHIPPEILRCDLSACLLEMKCIGVNEISRFPFLTPPSDPDIVQALELLRSYGCVGGKQTEYELTDLGKKIGALPVIPKHGFLLYTSIKYKCVSEMLTIVAMLSMEVEWFSNCRSQKASEKTKLINAVAEARRRIFHPLSDHLSLLNLYLGWKRCLKKNEYCQALGVDGRSLQRADRIREQLKDVLCRVFELSNVSSTLSYWTPETKKRGESEEQNIDPYYPILRCLADGYIVQRARLIRTEGTNKITRRKKSGIFSEAIAAMQNTDGKKEEPIEGTSFYVDDKTKEIVQLHPGSCLFEQKRHGIVVYESLMETSKIYIQTITAIEPDWILCA